MTHLKDKKRQVVVDKVLPPDFSLLDYSGIFFSSQQKEFYAAYCKGGTINAAARLISSERERAVNPAQVSVTIRNVQAKALLKGWVPKSKDIKVDEKVVEKNTAAVKRRLKNAVSTFVVTWAQNATPVHADFLKSLERYCKHKNALLLVIAGRYKNPTSQWNAKQGEDEYWVDEVAPYLIDNRMVLNPNMIVMGDIKTQPTAENPLSGFKSITQDKSGIFGHSKIALESVATPQNSLPKLLTTTGAVTVENYTDSKTGAKGEFHHTFGAVVVEIQGDLFHMRQINACKDGSFIDLEHEYFPNKVRKAARPLGLVLGDIHTEFIDPQCEESVFGKGGLVEVFNPRNVVFHDLYDGYSGSHHHKDQLFINFAKHHSGMNNVKAEILRTLEKTRGWVRRGIEYHVVDSNHNQHLVIWLQKVNPKTDFENTQFWCEIMAKMLPETVMGKTGAEYPNPLEMLAKQTLNLSNLHFLTSTDELMIGEIDCSQHGHRGPNGSHGSINSFSTLGVKNITGHGHTPGIKHGHYRVGTNSRFDLEYVDGPSSWLHTDCLIYANGKRTLINKMDGKWRATRRGKK